MIGAKTAHRKNARKRASHPCPTPILPRDSRASRRAPTAAARLRCCNPRTWNSRHPFHPTRARTTPPPAWHKRSSAPYKAAVCEIINLSITVMAMDGRYRTTIRRFSGFPAVSLPRLRFDRRVARKVLIRRGFSMPGEPRKIFSLSFPERQGRGGGGAKPCRLSSLWRRRRLLLAARRQTVRPGAGRGRVSCAPVYRGSPFSAPPPRPARGCASRPLSN